METESTNGCPANCGHNEGEHRAFDRGLKDGEEKGLQANNPYASEMMREAWENGHSVGLINRKSMAS